MEAPPQNQKNQLRELPERITYRIRQFMFSAVAIVAGIAWSDVFSALYKKGLQNVHGNVRESVIQMSLYAVILTALGVLITILITTFSAWVSKKKKD